jgi:hypothetical protein
MGAAVQPYDAKIQTLLVQYQILTEEGAAVHAL